MNDKIYLMDEPFKTRLTTLDVNCEVTVVAYCPLRACPFLTIDQAAGGFSYWMKGKDFDPQPPTPAAARKPQVGEVWLTQYDDQVLLLTEDQANKSWFNVYAADGIAGIAHIDILTRPATPEESKPFRPILDGLKRSLGDEA